MIENIAFLVASFVGLFIAIFWLQVILFIREDKTRKNNQTPLVSLIVPAYNEEQGATKTLDSLLKSDYPNLEIIFVNDGSTDRTLELVKPYAKHGVKIIDKPNGGKASALNMALKVARGKYVGVLDADSTIQKDSIHKLVSNFISNDIGAVISMIKIRSPKTIFEKVQHYEYILISYIRKLMSNINTLYVTPGVLSLYRKSAVKKVGGFDEKENLTEDLEIALNLRRHHYRVLSESNSITYTSPPKTFWELWRQRVRWYRGLIQNTVKHRKMLFNSKYGLFGVFQFPLLLVTQAVLVISLSLFLTKFGGIIYDKITTIFIVLSTGNIGSVNINLILNLIGINQVTSAKMLLYSLNPEIIFPFSVALIMAGYLLYMAHVKLKESWKYLPTFLVYFFVMPFVSAMHWGWAIMSEIAGLEKEW